jgi:hypothetical protein
MRPKSSHEEPIVPYKELYADLFNTIVEEHMGAFESLHKLLVDEDAIAFHLDKETKDVKQGSGKFNMKKAIELWDKAMLSHAIAIYAQQTIVIMVSIAESLIQTFFECVFCRYPERMYDYISSKNIDNSLKGKIDLRGVLQYPTREELILSLASRAGEIAMQGKFQSSINNFKTVTKGKFDEEILSKLIPLVEQRNRIIHELSREEEITYKYIMDLFGVISNTFATYAVESG